jgi:hypothetical protein
LATAFADRVGERDEYRIVSLAGDAAPPAVAVGFLEKI